MSAAGVSSVRDLDAEVRTACAAKRVSDVAPDGRHFIEQWRVTAKRVDQACAEVTKARADASNATDALMKWMVPEDVSVGEKIAIWHVDELIQVEVMVLNPLRGVITIRKRGLKAELR